LIYVQVVDRSNFLVLVDSQMKNNVAQPGGAERR